eukprot:5595761-Ditylum_brightwellii.AAC.1
MSIEVCAGISCTYYENMHFRTSAQHLNCFLLLSMVESTASHGTTDDAAGKQNNPDCVQPCGATKDVHTKENR